MRCVVVIGMGIIFSIGNDVYEVFLLLKEGWFGVVYNEEYVEMGFCLYVCGVIDVDVEGLVDC